MSRIEFIERFKVASKQQNPGSDKIYEYFAIIKMRIPIFAGQKTIEKVKEIVEEA